MFTGLVTALGMVRAVSPAGDGVDLDVDLGPLAAAAPARRIRIGDSIALSGVCCTVVRLEGAVARFHLTPETLSRSRLGSMRPGDAVNLEGALLAGEPLGGHFVQGHVDGVATVAAAIDAQQGGMLGVRVPAALQKYCVEKGSIALDGVSLTIAALQADELRIAVIPHTAQATTLGRKRVGDPLHVEVDVLAKYVERLLADRR
jgi:riboflavin synthase